MPKNKAKRHCPHCLQASSRHWNLKTHIRRKHQGIGQPIGEDEWHFTPTPTSTTTTMHFIPDMMSLQNNKNNDYWSEFSGTSKDLFYSLSQKRRRHI